jgi:hypothetical protein
MRRKEKIRDCRKLNGGGTWGETLPPPRHIAKGDFSSRNWSLAMQRSETGAESEVNKRGKGLEAISKVRVDGRLREIIEMCFESWLHICGTTSNLLDT